VIRFPDGFVWGAATAAYQIEGARFEDGRLDSIWDTFSHTPGAVANGDTGDVACEHYHRYRDDVAIMGELGLHAYRFSIAWPRVVPTGSGTVNAAGLDFYSRLVDELRSHGIRPFVTLYHWDLPQPLQDAGGWANRDTAQRFAEFCTHVAAVLGDRVDVFTTLNEPWCSAFLGYASGAHAPGVRDDAAAYRAAHHLLLAHGLGVQALRATLPATAEVSITLNPHVVRPASNIDADRRAAERVDLVTNRLFAEPLRHGSYPAALVAETAAVTDWRFVADGDLAAIAAPIDFLGVNYYQPTRIGAVPADPRIPNPWPGVAGAYEHPNPPPHTGMGWGIDPDAFTEFLVTLAKEFAPTPLVVTENGSAFPDPDHVVDAGVHDSGRTSYLTAHLSALHRAIEDGADVRGYFAWSLLDNFEWAWGYAQRFGIVHVDFTSQERTVKQSGLTYLDVIRANGMP